VEVKAEESDDDISQRHATQSVERVLDVRRRKQTKNELDGVLGVAEAKLYHVHESTINSSNDTEIAQSWNKPSFY